MLYPSSTTASNRAYGGRIEATIIAITPIAGRSSPWQLHLRLWNHPSPSHLARFVYSSTQVLLHHPPRSRTYHILSTAANL